MLSPQTGFNVVFMCVVPCGEGNETPSPAALWGNTQQDTPTVNFDLHFFQQSWVEFTHIFVYLKIRIIHRE